MCSNVYIRDDVDIVDTMNIYLAVTNGTTSANVNPADQKRGFHKETLAHEHPD